MNKPFPLIYREFKDAIVKAINDTHLDIGVVQLMLEPIVEEVYKTAEQEAKKQIDGYISELNREEIENIEEESQIQDDPIVTEIEEEPK